MADHSRLSSSLDGFHLTDTKGSLESTQITAQISERPHMNHTKKAASVEDSDSRCTSEDPAKGTRVLFVRTHQYNRTNYGPLPP